MTPLTRHHIAALLGVVLLLSACGRPATPEPTVLAPTARPTVAPTATPTATLRPTTAPTITPSPTPALGMGLTAQGLANLLAAPPLGPLKLAPTGQVGELQRLEATNAISGLSLVATARGEELLCLETRLDTTGIEADAVQATLQGLLTAALPEWRTGASWLEQALTTTVAGGTGASTAATPLVQATLQRGVGPRGPLVLVLSMLRCDGEPVVGELQPFDPTLGLGIGRQALQWAFEGLASSERLSFARTGERLGQPVVVGTSSDSRATLTLVGPEAELVYVDLSLAAPAGSAQAEASAVALAQLLARVALPAWAGGEAWMAQAVRSALAGVPSEQRRSGLRLLVQQDPASAQLVDITLTAVRAGVAPLPTLTPTPTPVLTEVRVSGLPEKELGCLTAVFYRAEAEVGRLPLSAAGLALGPEADEVLIEGDPSGACPWKHYWTPRSRLAVAEGQAAFAFAPVN